MCIGTVILMLSLGYTNIGGRDISHECSLECAKRVGPPAVRAYSEGLTYSLKLVVQ